MTASTTRAAAPVLRALSLSLAWATPLPGGSPRAVTRTLPSLPRDPRPGDRAPHLRTRHCDCPVCPDQTLAPCPARAVTRAPSPTPWSRQGPGGVAGQAHDPADQGQGHPSRSPTPSDRDSRLRCSPRPRSRPAWWRCPSALAFMHASSTPPAPPQSLPGAGPHAGTPTPGPPHPVLSPVGSPPFTSTPRSPRAAGAAGHAHPRERGHRGHRALRLRARGGSCALL